MRAVIGADWDSKKCVVAFERDGSLHTVNVNRNPDSVSKFMARLDASEVLVGIEAGDRLWQRLWENAGAVVFVFDGKKARRFSESLLSSGARDDSRSATDLRSMVLSDAHCTAVNRADGATAGGLEYLLRACDTASGELTREESRLRSMLRQFHPAVADVVGTKLRSASILNAVENAPTPSTWTQLATVERMAIANRFRESSREKLADAFGANWGAVRQDEEQAVRIVVRAQVRAVRSALARKKNADAELEAALKHDAVGERVTKIDGIGPFIGGALSVAAAQSEGATHRDGLAIKLGAAPITIRSGERGDARPAVRVRLSANNTLRKSCHLFGLQLVQRHSWANAQYHHYMNQGTRPATACRRIVRSFSRILNAMNRDGTDFDESMYIRRLQSRNVPWAMDLVA